MKGKGATDMWLADEPIERTQMLCGHASKAATERYIKARWRETRSAEQAGNRALSASNIQRFGSPLPRPS
jgi:integrase